MRIVCCAEAAPEEPARSAPASAANRSLPIFMIWLRCWFRLIGCDFPETLEPRHWFERNHLCGSAACQAMPGVEAGLEVNFARGTPLECGGLTGPFLAHAE